MGMYAFTGLAGGSYYLVFSLPIGASFTLQDQGADDTVDSDANGAGQTAVFTLSSGQHRTDVDAGAVPASMAPSSGSVLPLLDEAFEQMGVTPLDEMAAALELVAVEAAASPAQTNVVGQVPDSPASESLNPVAGEAVSGLLGLPLLLSPERKDAVADLLDCLFSEADLQLTDDLRVEL